MSRSIARRWGGGLATLLLGALLLGCGGDDDDDVTPDSSVAVVDSGATVDGSGPGKLTIRADNVTGATGKVVLAFVTPQPAGAALGAVCQQITTSPQSVSGVAKTPSMTNPCDLGAEVSFPAGSYKVSGGIYTPGQQTPERCASATVTIAGDTSVTLPAFGTCP